MTEVEDAEIAAVHDRQAARERGFRWLAVTVSALFLAFAALGAAFLWYDDTSAWVTHTFRVRSGVADLLQHLTDAESAQRAYVMTGDRAFAVRITEAEAQARADLGAVQALTRDNPAQQQRAASLGRSMDARTAVISQTVAARAAGDPVAAIRIIRAGEGVATMNEVRRQVAALDQAERRLETRRQSLTASIRVLILLALVAFSATLAALFGRALRDLGLERDAAAEQAQQLRRLLADRTLLLGEVNHRVKNSLQQIASVVRLQARAAADPETREALDKTLARIMAVGRVHEQLYQAGGEVGQFDAGLYAQALAHELVESLGREGVELETQVTPALLDLRQAVPLAIILNELITNALKYGCSADKACRLRVAFGTQGENYRLSVSDNGPGLPHGAAAAPRSGLGMRVIGALARQLEGQFIVEHPPTGAAFAVVFPRSRA